MSDQEKAPEANEKVKEGVKGGLQANLDALVKFGGFDLFESVIEGAQNLNPERKARKQIFLTEAHNAVERANLKGKLQLWIDTLTGSDDITERRESVQEKSEERLGCYSRNGEVLPWISAFL